MPANPREVTAILDAWSEGDLDALEQLVPRLWCTAPR
jgi:hypothetical protein